MTERQPSPDEFIRGPKWRTRTSPAKRHRMAIVSVAVVAAVGTAVMWACMTLLRWLDAPSWVVLLPWLLPTAGALLWTVIRPTVADVTDDDDDSWLGYSIRWAMVGESEPRPTALRIVAAVVIGAPVVWAVIVSGLLSLIGLF